MLVPVLCVSVMESTPQSAATAKQEMRVTLVGTGGVRWEDADLATDFSRPEIIL